MKAYIATLGCALNQSDSYLMIQLLKEKNQEITNTPETADIIIVNTCTVRKDSEEKSIKTIYEAMRKNPRAKLIITGCMASAQPYTLLKYFPNAILISPENTSKITEAIGPRAKKVYLERNNEKRRLIPHFIKGAIATIPLNDGCLGECSYCITVRARRRLLSRSPRAIIETIRDLVVNKRVYEIQLASQDSAVYGIDITGKPLLPDLVRTIHEKIEGDYALRIGMMTPEWAGKILDDIIDIYRLPNTYKFLHLPLQSGDNRVLKAMNRQYTVEEYEEMIKEIRSKVPDITIATDIIVGHPGEDEAAFENTIKLIKTIRFERIHIAQYTPRPQTLSARLPQIPDPIKKKRSTVLSKLYEEIGYEYYKKYVGKTIDAVIVEDWGFGKKKSLTARTMNYISIVIPWNTKLQLGQKVKIHIDKATFFDLRGSILEQA